MKTRLQQNIVFFSLILAVLALMVTGCSDSATTTTTSAAPDVELNVSCAASVTDALTAINTAYMAKNKNVTVVANFAASGTLQTQIEQGAPADVFISAASKQMNALQDKGLILDETRRDLLNNKVVMIVPVDSTLGLDDYMDLVNDDVKQIAIGDPEFVPAGTYAKQAFELLGIWDALQGKLIMGSDVRQVLGYVEGGNVDAGIVYSTDAAITDGVKIVASAPDEINSKIVYPAAVIKDSTKAEAAQAYIDFLFSDDAKAIFNEYGFSVVS